MAIDEGPRHDRCDLAAMMQRESGTKLEQFSEIRRPYLRHFEWPRLVWSCFNVLVGRACCHEGVTRHMVPLAIVIVLRWMMEILFIRVVRANDEVLHVIHTRTFEPTRKSERQLQSWLKRLAYRSETCALQTLSSLRRRCGVCGIHLSTLGAVR